MDGCLRGGNLRQCEGLERRSHSSYLVKYTLETPASDDLASKTCTRVYRLSLEILVFRSDLPVKTNDCRRGTLPVLTRFYLRSTFESVPVLPETFLGGSLAAQVGETRGDLSSSCGKVANHALSERLVRDIAGWYFPPRSPASLLSCQGSNSPADEQKGVNQVHKIVRPSAHVQFFGFEEKRFIVGERFAHHHPVQEQ